jgi:hypothetical protein
MSEDTPPYAPSVTYYSVNVLRADAARGEAWAVDRVRRRDQADVTVDTDVYLVWHRRDRRDPGCRVAVRAASAPLAIAALNVEAARYDSARAAIEAWEAEQAVEAALEAQERAGTA